MRKRSVVRAVEILELISRNRNGLSLNEIVEATGIPKTTVYEILLMLQETSMVQVEESRIRRYQVGVQAFVIGSRFLQNFDLVNTAAPLVNKCCTQLGMTVFLAMLDGHEILYLYKKEPEKVLIHTEPVGNKGEVFCTSLGKAILSRLPEVEQREILSKVEFRPRTSRTHTSVEPLLADLALSRRRGYALDDREVLDFVYCVGVPVFDHRGRAIAGLSVAGIYSEDRDPEKEGRILREAAASLSRQLGFRKEY